MATISAGIIGGGGYTAGELIRLLLIHPQVTLDFVQSTSQAGTPISQVHEDLFGECFMDFVATPHFEVDVLFLCKGHGHSKAFVETHDIPASVVVIDLSRDFRLANASNPFVYGLPELKHAAIAQSNRIANAGCFATAIQLALLPLAQAQYLAKAVHIQAITGTTGAGQQPKSTSHFSWRHNNLSVYKAFQHQHVPEIKQSLSSLQEAPLPPLHFIPLRGAFTRGIFATLYTEFEGSEAAALALFQDYYEPHPFVQVTTDTIHLKQVVNTNKCLIQLAKHEDQLLIVCAIDNLLKGASGQAVQNMNIRFGFPEKQGLVLKAMAF
ncbi:MAG: N-acetyl-gamma-glutamyl-phosphate reductase [Bacteroidota bacterium]